jgi:hypothetical protein
MQIIIKNNLADTLIVKLYPKKQYVYNDLYKSSEFSSGYYETMINLQIKDSKEIYTSSNTNQKPFELVAKIFDSVIIKTIPNNRLIMFSINNLSGYSQNIFDSTSIWTYLKMRYSYKTEFSSHNIESDNYTFELH